MGIIQERVKVDEHGGMHFVFMCENRAMKLVRIVLRKGAEGQGRTMEGMYLTKVYCKHKGKCYDIVSL
jgi:hypothetical protein